jgi:hypothetical protein
VNFIDDIHFELSELRWIAYLVVEVPDVFDGVLMICIQFKNIERIGFCFFLQTPLIRRATKYVRK